MNNSIVRFSVGHGSIPNETAADESLLLTENWTREMLEGGEASPISSILEEEEVVKDLSSRFQGEGDGGRRQGHADDNSQVGGSSGEDLSILGAGLRTRAGITHVPRCLHGELILS